MKYMGSKNRIAKHILPIMLAERKPNQWWVEPFVGGANMIDKVDGNRLGADINPYLINALITIRDHVSDLPQNNKEFTEFDYTLLSTNDNYQYKGYAGFAFSYSGKWMGGWCRDGLGKRDYVKEAYANAIKQSPKLKNVIFLCENYLTLNIPSSRLLFGIGVETKLMKVIQFLLVNIMRQKTLSVFGVEQ